MAQKCLIRMSEFTFSLLKSVFFRIMVVWEGDKPVAGTETQGTQDLISLQSQGNVHITTHHLYSWLFILLHCVLLKCVYFYLESWLGSLAVKEISWESTELKHVCRHALYQGRWDISIS